MHFPPGYTGNPGNSVYLLSLGESSMLQKLDIITFKEVYRTSQVNSEKIIFYRSISSCMHNSKYSNFTVRLQSLRQELETKEADTTSILKKYKIRVSLVHCRLVYDYFTICMGNPTAFLPAETCMYVFTRHYACVYMRRASACECFYVQMKFSSRKKTVAMEIRRLIMH